PRSGVLFNKAVFAILSDPRYVDMFDREVAGALERHVPWTRVVRDGRAMRGQRQIDLLPFIAENREGLVLKPAYGAGGNGVVIGTECDADSWRRAIRHARAHSYVVQERVELGGGVFPYLDGEAVRFAHHNGGLDPF